MAARLLILLFAVRAVIPIGVMPDFAALRDGRLEIVICTATGAETVQIDRDGQPVESDPRGKPKAIGGNDCPFHHAIGHAFVAPNAVLLGRASDRAALSALIVPDVSRQPPPPGPPLGPRAPPLRLG